MAVTDPQAVAFCNRSVRRAADQLSTLYYECKHLSNLKVADGDTQATIDLRSNQIRRVAELMLSSATGLLLTENTWFNVGVPTILNVLIPNDAAEDVVDGSPSDGRPPITGEDVHNAMDLVIDFDNWLQDASFGGSGNGPQRNAMLTTMLLCSNAGNNPLVVAEVDTFVDNRCGEIVTEYEATSNAKLTQLLAVSPNPRNPE